MRIAITVDPYIPVPPLHYGGIERVVDFLVRALLVRGHEVTLFAHPESRTEARLMGYGLPPHSGIGLRLMEIWQVAAGLWSMREQLDLVHSFGRLAALLPILPLRRLPKIQSYQRDRISRKGIGRALRLAGDSLQFTACSTHMYSRPGLPGRWTTVFNGVDLEKYGCRPEVPRDAPLAFLGRLERIKGVREAIAIARESGRKIVIAGNIVREGPDGSYFDDEVAPAIDGNGVRYVGPVDDGQKNELLGSAAALLVPVRWEEPFGIVMVEAMACGTPVIAFDRGSAREIVRDGINGFVVDDVRSAVEAVGRLPSLSRAGVRRDAELRFGSEVIVSAYERLYRSLART